MIIYYNNVYHYNKEYIMRLKAFDYRYNASKALEGKKIFMILVTIVYGILSGLFTSVVDYFVMKYAGDIVFFKE